MHVAKAAWRGCDAVQLAREPKTPTWNPVLFYSRDGRLLGGVKTLRKPLMFVLAFLPNMQ